ncbi:hypothetical protein CEP54_011467 [Fusarium duplospermum]|uniref:Uncharacterized protein n=1 Tax=Fusarium duplospermum TaxID=1325734 RepID=A0A428PEF3_9HYPO|nr:hypothetical protein CEP54_011467 [Fusarium duplospermum]
MAPHLEEPPASPPQASGESFAPEGPGKRRLAGHPRPRWWFLLACLALASTSVGLYFFYFTYHSINHPSSLQSTATTDIYHEPLGVYVDVLVMLDSYAANFLRFALWTHSSQLSDIPNLVDKVCNNITEHGAIWNPSSDSGLHQSDLEWLLRPTDERDMTKPRDTSQDIDVFDFCSSTAIAAQDAVFALSRLSTKARLHSAGDAISLLEWLGMSVREDMLTAHEAKLSKIPQPTIPVGRRIESGGLLTRGPEEPLTKAPNKTRRRDLSTMPASHLNESKAMRDLNILLKGPISLNSVANNGKLTMSTMDSMHRLEHTLVSLDVWLKNLTTISVKANEKAVSTSKAAKPANFLSVVLNSLRRVPAKPSLPTINTDMLCQATSNVSRVLGEALLLQSQTQKVLACERAVKETVGQLLKSIKLPDLKDPSARLKTGEWVVKRKRRERASMGRSRALRECEGLLMKGHYPDHLSHQDVLASLQEWDEASGGDEAEHDIFQLFVPDPFQVFQLLYWSWSNLTHLDAWMWKKL